MTEPVTLDNDAPRLRVEPFVAPAGHGVKWLAEGWALFLKAPLTLVLMFGAYLVIAILAGLIPLVGDLFASLTGGLWAAGFALAFDRLRRDETITVASLFAGFEHRAAKDLFLVGVLYIALFVALCLLVALLAVLAFGLGNLHDFQDPHALVDRLLANVGIFIGLVMLAVTGLFLVVSYLLYAPVLIALHEVPVAQACSLSLRAVLGNWLSMTVIGLLWLALLVATAFTLFLGVLVLMPVTYAALYASYRDIFLEPGAAADPQPTK